MRKIKNHQMGLIGLCVTATLALTAFAASAAQAATPEWMLGANPANRVDATLSPELIEFENGASKDDVKAALLLSKTSLGAPIWISCKVVSSAAAGITLEEEGRAKGELEFKECSTSLLNASKQMTLSAVCAPKQPIKASAVVSLILVASTEYAKVEAPAGGAFTTVTFSNEECAFFGQKYEVKGSVLFKDHEGKLGTEQLTHLLEEDMAATLTAGGGLTFGANSASIDGSGILEVFQEGSMRRFAGLA